MKHILLILAVVMVGCGESSPTVEIDDYTMEKDIRRIINKPEGELTEADLEKVTELGAGGRNHGSWKISWGQGAGWISSFELLVEKFTGLESLVFTQNGLDEVPKGLEKLPKLTKLYLGGNRLEDVKRLEKCTQLRQLDLTYNNDLYKDQIDELQKALPKCIIKSNPHWHSAPYGPRFGGKPSFGGDR